MRWLNILLRALPELLPVGLAAGADGGEMRIIWGKDGTSVSVGFRRKKVDYPSGIASQAKSFPAPGGAPKTDIKEDWPNFTMRARWSVTARGWVAAYRDSLLDYALVCSCGANLMRKLYPEMIREGRFTAPAEFRREAVEQEPQLHHANVRSIRQHRHAEEGHGDHRLGPGREADPVVDVRLQGRLRRGGVESREGALADPEDRRPQAGGGMRRRTR